MSEIVNYSKDQVIFLEGTQERCMYEIKSGSVDVIANYGKENQKTLTTLGEGRLFGELSIFDGQPRSASVIAAGECSLEKIDAEEVSGYLTDDPDKIYQMFHSITVRIRELTQDYMDVCTMLRSYNEIMKEPEPKKKGFFSFFTRKTK